MIGELAILILSTVIGLPLALLGASATFRLTRRMEPISRLSAWVGRAGLAAGVLVSLLICVGVLTGENWYFAPLAGLGAALFVELVVGSQLRNGIKAWERRERGTKSVGEKSIIRQIDERLEVSGVPAVERTALRVQRSVLRWLKLGTGG